MKFKETHEWVDLSGDIATIGISQFAQHEIGEIVYIELPKIGSRVKIGDEIVILESTKAAVDIYAPISGEIVEINLSLKESPEKINESPESEGWLYKLKISDIKEYEALLDHKSYLALIEMVV
jgi:glycine cleavage system H protein